MARSMRAMMKKDLFLGVHDIRIDVAMRAE
jgi:hypothetical protein